MIAPAVEKMIPELYVEDPEAIADWFSQVLGFRCVGSSGQLPEVRIGLASGDIELAFRRCTGTAQPAQAVLHIQVSNIAAVLDRVLASKTPLVDNLEIDLFGGRGFAVEVPAAHGLTLRFVQRHATPYRSPDKVPSR